MSTLSKSQKRAALAYEHVHAVLKSNKDDKEKQKKYGSMIHSLPQLLRSAGLSQTLHFVASRSDTMQQKPLEHLAAQLGRLVDQEIKDEKTLLERVRKAKLGTYLRLQEETLACVDWYRRFVQSVLKVEAGDDNG